MNEKQKAKAIEFMERMEIYKPYIDGFKRSGKVCFYENFGGFWVEQEPEIYDKMKALEKEYGCVVYAITHEYTLVGELYDFLIVTKYASEWKNLVYTNGNTHTAFAYVWNKTDDVLSEFGSITVKHFGGGIKRIG